MTIRILGRKILLKEVVEEEKEERTASGLIIPGSVHKPRTILKGKVVSYGLDCHYVEEGNTVFFDINSAAEVRFEGEDYVIVDESSVFAIGR